MPARTPCGATPTVRDGSISPKKQTVALVFFFHPSPGPADARRRGRVFSGKRRAHPQGQNTGAATITTFENTYASLPDRFFARVAPEPAPAPRLLAWNAPLARELGLAHLADDEASLARTFAGNNVPEDAEPIALAYAGHQFASFVPQLGDGRAILLGELATPDGRRVDVQLKGAGRTPFSRGGDGKSWLGPVIREYVLSEAMHALGVPTTRALAAVSTGEQVYRERALPGGVLTRVAASHLRIGTFEYFAARDDAEGVETLARYAIERHYPEAAAHERPWLSLFDRVVDAQATLVAHWLDVGFIHGVMNTDNTTISGETLDYGPCAFMDEFRFDKTFSSIDQRGRYAYANQPAMAHWNLARLAECLLVIDDDPPGYRAALERFAELFDARHVARMRRKLGLTSEEPEDAKLIGEWLGHLQNESLDYTLSFRQLAGRADAPGPERFGEFEQRWKARLARQPEEPAQIRALMDAANPLYIPRNHQVERAIRGALEDDLTIFHELNRVLASPFVEQPGMEDYAQPPRAEERVVRTFCGT